MSRRISSSRNDDDFFSVQLSATSNAAANIPALQWHCQQHALCTRVVESLHCKQSIFAHASDFQAYLYDLRQAEWRQDDAMSTTSICHEIFVQDGFSIFSSLNNTCTTSAATTNDHDTMHSCPAVFYRISNGQNQYATCPRGSLLVVHAVGLQADFQSYILTMNTTQVQLVDDVIPLECEVMQQQQQEEIISYMCASGSVTFQFMAAALDNDNPSSRISDSSARRGGVGYCDDKCHGIPSPEPPSDDDDKDEFSVQVESTDNFAHLPDMEWTCRVPGYDDCWVAPGFGNLTTTSCMEHLVNSTSMDLDLLDLQDNVCHKIVIDNSTCPQVFYRQNGMVGPSAPIPTATCPIGSILQVSASLPTTVTELVFVPAVYNDDVELPDGCVSLADTIQCNAAATTTVSLTFAYGRRSWPLSGSLYGSCPSQSNNETFHICMNGTHVQDVLPPPTTAPTEIPTSVPTTASPTFVPTTTSQPRTPRPTTTTNIPFTAVPTTLQPTQAPSSSSSSTSLSLSFLDAWVLWVSLLVCFLNLRRR